jgi:hypothetical protein
MLLSTAPAWERLFRQWLPILSGVMLTEASKQVYSGLPAPARARRLRVAVPAGAAAARNGR